MKLSINFQYVDQLGDTVVLKKPPFEKLSTFAFVVRVHYYIVEVIALSAIEVPYLFSNNKASLNRSYSLCLYFYEDYAGFNIHSM